MRDIPLPEETPVVEDLFQIVGVAAFLLGMLSAALGLPGFVTAVLFAGSAVWYLTGAFLKWKARG